MNRMRMKHQNLALIFLIIGVATIGAILLIETNNGKSPPSASSLPIVQMKMPATVVSSEIGETFQVNITIVNASDVHVWQTGINFNATLLEAINFEEGPFLKQNGQTIWIPGSIDNTAGIIHYSASALTGNTTSANGDGTIGIVTFRVKSQGDSDVQLTDVLVLDSQLDAIPRSTENGTIRMKMPGDVNGNGIVDVSDLYRIGKGFEAKSGEPSYDIEADLNSDGTIDIFDLASTSHNFGKRRK